MFYLLLLVTPRATNAPIKSSLCYVDHEAGAGPLVSLNAVTTMVPLVQSPLFGQITVSDLTALLGAKWFTDFENAEFCRYTT
jgi:hypothetical protein